MSRACIGAMLTSGRITLAAAALGFLPAAHSWCSGVKGENIKACGSARDIYKVDTAPPPAANGNGDMRDVEVVFKQFGWKGLELLNVTYAGGAILNGAATRINNAKDVSVGSQPTIQWDCGGCSAMVLMLDPDCGGRRPGHPEAVGWCGPVLHAMWHDCTGNNLLSCKTVRLPYLPPGVARGTNRYSFVLLRQAKPLAVASLPEQSARPKGVASYDVARLLSSNHLQAIAWNFMFVTGNGSPAWKRAARRRNRSRGTLQQPPWEAVRSDAATATAPGGT